MALTHFETIDALLEYKIRWSKEIDAWFKYPIKDSVLPTGLKSKKTIYLVQGDVPYEYTNVIKAFCTEGKANDFIEKCEKYDKLRVDTVKWRAAHPAGCGYYEHYEVCEVELE